MNDLKSIYLVINNFCTLGPSKYISTTLISQVRFLPLPSWIQDPEVDYGNNGFRKVFTSFSITNCTCIEYTTQNCFKGTVMQIENTRINDRLRVSKVSWKFRILTIL